MWRPLLQQDWILDVDTTVKPLYGRQEGAQVGYNPHKRGRPAQVIHVYEMGTTRLVLEAEVEGKQHHSQYGLPGLELLLDRLAEAERPALVRGDCGYGVQKCSLRPNCRMRGACAVAATRPAPGRPTSVPGGAQSM